MKRLFIAAALVAAFASCKKDSVAPTPAPVTLSASDVSKTFASGKTVNYAFVDLTATPVTAPTNAENQTWDFSSLNLSGGNMSDNLIAASSGFPSSAYGEMQPLVYVGGQTESVNLAFQISDSGWARLGTGIPGFNISVPAYGATISYAAQASKFNKMLPLTPPFPIKFGDVANISNVTRTENFTITAAAFGLNNTPGAQKYTTNGTIKAWATGKLKLAGYASAMDVMIIKTSRATVYNYFLGGAPAPKNLLDLLGITDGESASTTYYDIYNPGGEGYLGEIIVDGSNSVQKAYFKTK